MKKVGEKSSAQKDSQIIRFPSNGKGHVGRHNMSCTENLLLSCLSALLVIHFVCTIQERNYVSEGFLGVEAGVEVAEEVGVGEGDALPCDGRFAAG